MVEFGPSGRCDLMEELGVDIMSVPSFLAERGLKTFEYPLTYGININSEKAKIIGDEFKKFNITLSVHAPYYINLANSDDLMAQKSFGYIISSIKIMKAMGADRLVFHPGALMGQSRDKAQKLILERLKELIEILKEQNLLEGIYLCPETMGKHGQCGTVEEVAEMCQIDEHIMPTIDFGHVNAFTLGSLNSVEAFENLFKILKNKLGERGHIIHGHFSRIQFGEKGELKHLNFDSDLEFGPNHQLLNQALINCKIDGRVICESHGHQTIDAIEMRKDYLEKINS